MKKKLAFLLRVGFPKEVAEQIVKAEDLADDFDTDAQEETVRGALADTFKNDAEFMKGVRTPIIGEVLSGRERQLMKLAKDVITTEEFEALPKEGRFDKALELVVTKLKTTKPDGKNEEAWTKERGELVKTMEALQADVTRYKDEVVPGLEKKAVDVEHGFHIRGAIQSAAMKGDRKMLLAADKTTGLLLEDITSEHDLVWDPKAKKTVVLQKGTTMPAFHPTERSKQLTVDDLVGTIGEKNGYFVMNGSKDKPKDTPGGGGTNTDKEKFALPGLAKAKAHEQSLAPASAE